MAKTIEAVVFDLGGVLIDWNPRYLYRKLFDCEEAMELFLREVCNDAWNARQDAGRTFSEATETLIAEHPDKAELIRAYYDRWPEMLAGSLPRNVAILADLKEAGIPLYSLTNWSAETFPIALQRFDFLQWFQDIIVSGIESLLFTTADQLHQDLRALGLPLG